MYASSRTSKKGTHAPARDVHNNDEAERTVRYKSESIVNMLSDSVRDLTWEDRRNYAITLINTLLLLTLYGFVVWDFFLGIFVNYAHIGEYLPHVATFFGITVLVCTWIGVSWFIFPVFIVAIFDVVFLALCIAYWIYAPVLLAYVYTIPNQ